jgi:type II secretory pathway pseudopilin PulG
MAALMVAIAVMGIMTAVAAQWWSDVKRRDDEAEMIFRAREIARGLVMYRRDRGALPTDLEQLFEPGGKGQYFVRKKYTDPLVKDGKWGLLYAGPAGNVFDPNSPNPVDPSQLPTGPSPAQDNPGGLGTLQRSIGAGQQVGGLPIVGVKSLCKDKPFRVIDDKQNYADWQFHIFQLEAVAGQPGAPGQPGRPGRPGANRPGTPGGVRPGGSPRNDGG